MWLDTSVHEDRGFSVVGIPSRDFKQQEFDTSEKAVEFCRMNYGVTFPMGDITHVIGQDAHELYKLCTAVGGAPQWNFHKYLIDRNGRVAGSFGYDVGPGTNGISMAIESLL